MTVLANLQLVTADGHWPDGWLSVAAGLVESIGRGPFPGRADVDLAGAIVVPGFTDVHCHGGGGASYAAADAEEVHRAASFHRRHGTTTMLASVVSDRSDHLVHQLSVLSECARAGVIAGVHLEGPYLSPHRCGAHDPGVLRDPDVGELERLHDAAGEALRMVTLAPERPGACEAIAWLVRRGVVAAVGHTDATYDQTRAAIEAGARMATHLGNAMGPLHHRQPGPALALLEDDRVGCELIADGIHLHDRFAAFVARSAGPDRIALVTDAIAAAGMPDGDYHLGQADVSVTAGEARTRVGGALAGSTLTLDVAFRRAVHEYGLSIRDAVRATSTVPARLLGLAGAGALTPGSPADLVVLDDSLTCRGVMAAGAWVVSP